MAQSYDRENDAKADFACVYTAPTPHAYLEMMSRFEYEIAERARPYCAAAAGLLSHGNGQPGPVQMLDVGCSYGIGSVVIKYGRSFHDLVRFVHDKMPVDYNQAVAGMRDWLESEVPAINIRSIGVDSSHPAIRFATDAGILDCGIARDFEHIDIAAAQHECESLRTSNLLISTGAIGYVTDRTLDIILEHFGTKAMGQRGPFAIFTILRMFDVAPIQACFEKHGYQFAGVAGIVLPQRRFAHDEERDKVLSILEERGIDTSGLEDQGRHFANLYIAAPEDQFAELYRTIKAKQS